jgi:hypothetical protein
MISSLSSDLAKVDFSSDANVHSIREKLAEIINLMHGHASHENSSIHALLENKGSSVHKKIEAEHSSHADTFKKLNQLLTAVLESWDPVQKIELGYQFYLGYQCFEAENLLHQLYEETVIMPEIQRLYTDEEILAKVDAKTYALMTPDQMVDMIKVLFPYFNADDREAFLRDIYKSEPVKFREAWKGIATILEAAERKQLIARLGIQFENESAPMV